MAGSRDALEGGKCFYIINRYADECSWNTGRRSLHVETEIAVFFSKTSIARSSSSVHGTCTLRDISIGIDIVVRHRCRQSMWTGA